MLAILAALALVTPTPTLSADAPPTAECCRHADLAERYGILWTRVGIRTVDIWDFDQIGYVFEFGAGSW